MEVQALVRRSDDVADLPAGETVFGEPRMVGDPRITTAQASVALTMTRQRVWNLAGPDSGPAVATRSTDHKPKSSPGAAAPTRATAQSLSGTATD
jgi:hypothetical protein